MKTNNNILFGKFEIIDTLKKDEFSQVFLANHHYLGKKIILKTLETFNLSDASIADRFKREAKILARLEHPSIIKVLDFGFEENRSLYISFEYFESKNLREYLKDFSPAYETKISLISQLIGGLNYAHKNGIIHRDIKPENILVDINARLKIADFGLAIGGTETGVTQKSSVLGTPSYMSPEQIFGDEITNQSDLFSLGIVIYEMFSGSNPFLKNDINSTINFILNFDLNTFEYLEKAPKNIKELLISLLQKDKSLRAKNTGELYKYFHELTTDANLLNNLPDSKNEIGIAESASKQKNNKSGIILDNKKKLVLSFILFFLTFIALWLIIPQINLSVNGNESGSNENQVNNPSIHEEMNSDKSEPISDNKSQELNELKKNVVKNEKLTDGIKNEKEIVPQNEVMNKETKKHLVHLNINCSPWATLFLNGSRLEDTPVNFQTELSEGEYTLEFIHPDYPKYRTTFLVNREETINYKVNLNSVFAEITFQIYPWGEVYINSKSFGQTPFKKSIFLDEGKYMILIKNPLFPDYQKNIELKKGQRMNVTHNFERNE